MINDEPVVFMKVESSRLINGQLIRAIEFGVERDGKFVSNTQLEAERCAREALEIESGLLEPVKHAKGGRL